MDACFAVGAEQIGRFLALSKLFDFGQEIDRNWGNFAVVLRGNLPMPIMASELTNESLLLMAKDPGWHRIRICP
jgi:hypothetical protein